MNRLTTTTPPSPAPVVRYTYDLAGRVTSVSDTGSPVVAAVPPAGTAVQYTTSATYDPLNQPSHFTWTPAASNVTLISPRTAGSPTATMPRTGSSRPVEQGTR